MISSARRSAECHNLASLGLARRSSTWALCTRATASDAAGRGIAGVERRGGSGSSRTRCRPWDRQTATFPGDCSACSVARAQGSRRWVGHPGSGGVSGAVPPTLSSRVCNETGSRPGGLATVFRQLHQAVLPNNVDAQPTPGWPNTTADGERHSQQTSARGVFWLLPRFLIPQRVAPSPAAQGSAGPMGEGYHRSNPWRSKGTGGDPEGFRVTVQSREA